MTKNGIEFAKRVGVVCGALLATGALMTGVYTLATKPIMNAVAEERSARIVADSALGKQLANLSHDRVMLLNLLEYPPGSRERKIEVQTLRRLWTEEVRR